MNLFEPIQLKHLKLKNGFVRSATHDYLQKEDGLMSQAQQSVYEQLAKHQVGLIISGHLYVSKKGQASNDQNGIDCDDILPRMKEVVESVHQQGGCFIAQLAHAGAKARVEEPLGPSVLELREGCPSKEMTKQDIEEVKVAFIEAAKRAKEAGFDGVQVHMAHGYLLSEFTTEMYNKRTDEYGGNRENRFRLPKEIILGIQEACGSDYPIFVKINSNALMDDEAYEQDLIYYVKQFEAFGIEAVELSGCDFSSKKRSEHVYYLKRAQLLKTKVNVPLILVGGIRTLDDVKAVKEAGIDLVSLSRPFICEADFVEKLQENQSSQCLSCNQCFGLYYRKGKRCVRHQSSV